MTEIQIKDYLKKYNIDSEESLAKHIEELKRNTIPNNEIIFPLVDMLLNEKSVLSSFFAENKKQEMFTRTVTPFFLDEAIYSTRHKVREEGNFHKEIVGDLEGINRPPSTHNELQKYIDDLKQYKDDVITNRSRGEKETMKGLRESKTAYKETEGKLFYELDWEFITQMAERMASNKKDSKYNLWNWKKPMTTKGIEDLKQATLRHLLEVLEGRYEDDGREFGHLEAISDNMMMINYQLKVK